MEKIVRLGRTENSLFLETGVGSMMVVLPGGILFMTGFFDTVVPRLKHFSERLYHRGGVLYLEFKELAGTVHQIPIGQIDSSPALQAWLTVADRIIP